MIMKLPPTNGSGNGYYGHDSSNIISQYLSDPSDVSPDELDLPTAPGDFSEYMWMENEEEFDKQVMQQLEEEALMEQCIEAMLEDEQEIRNLHNQAQNLPHGPWEDVYESYDLCQEMNSLGLKDDLAQKSTLNPNAAEFVPGNFTSSASSAAPKEETSCVNETSSSNSSSPSDPKDTSQETQVRSKART